MKLSNYAQKLGIYDNPAWRMFQRGQISGYQLPTGTVIIEEPVEQAGPRPPKQQLGARYARVSASQNKKKLDTQAERLITSCHVQGCSQGLVVKEGGNAIKDQRPTLLVLAALQQNGTMHEPQTKESQRPGPQETQTQTQDEADHHLCGDPYSSHRSQSWEA